MASKKRNSAVLFCFFMVLMVLMGGCAVSTDYSGGENPMPASWAVASAKPPNKCIAINGEYLIRGLGRLKRDDPLTEIRLDVALGHAFPSNKMPSQVSMAVDEESGTLNYQFGPPVNQKYSVPTDCQNSWFKSEKKSNDLYIGEGGILDYSVHKMELTKAKDGDLIIHFTVEAQSTSFFVFKAHDTREIWSKFKLSGNSN
jgi:hypothetical protein